MALNLQKFISEVYVNGKFPKISRYTVYNVDIGHRRLAMYVMQLPSLLFFFLQS